MSQLHELPAARPFALGRDDGDSIWFANSAMTIKAGAATTGGNLFLMEVLAPAGDSPPLHVHHDEHEAFYVIEGELEIVCGTERFRAGPGAFAFLPSGIAHTFRVLGDQPARMLTIAVPGGIEDFFREVGRPAEGPGLPAPAPVDVATIKQVAARFNLEVVGPPLAPTE
jgi:mannose-6-phosphate isomerase-like protein (cupin superfamily)